MKKTSDLNQAFAEPVQAVLPSGESVTVTPLSAADLAAFQSYCEGIPARQFVQSAREAGLASGEIAQGLAKLSTDGVGIEKMIEFSMTPAGAAYVVWLGTKKLEKLVTLEAIKERFLYTDLVILINKIFEASGMTDSLEEDLAKNVEGAKAPKEKASTQLPGSKASQ